MHILSFTVFFCVLSVLFQFIFIGSPEYLLSLDPLRIGLSAVVSTLLFLVADVVNERYGLKITLRMIVFGILAQGIAIACANAAGIHVELALATFGLVGLFFGEVADASIYAAMRRYTGDRFLVLRTFVSTTVAILIEGAMLFYAATNLVLIIPQFTWKFLFSLLNLPTVFFFRKRLFGQ